MEDYIHHIRQEIFIDDVIAFQNVQGSRYVGDLGLIPEHRWEETMFSTIHNPW